ncbi:Rha family transcriptional regulator [Fusobacterium sp. SYSU M8A802]
MNIAIQEDSQYGLVVSSRIVAKELGKEHSKVLRTLDEILEKPNMASLIIPSFYKTQGQKREYKEYLLTKDGFILYMFNIQGYQDFKMAYINRFNEMEKLIQRQEFIDNRELLTKIQKLENELNQIPMSWSQVEVVKEQITETVLRRMRSTGISNRTFKLRLKKELVKDVQSRFGIDSLAELKYKDYLSVMPYIFNWIEPYQLRIENTQLQMI